MLLPTLIIAGYLGDVLFKLINQMYKNLIDRQMFDGK